VELTQDGHAFYERSKDLLADIEETQTMFQQGGEALRGRVRIDMSLVFARDAVIPKLPELLALHPLLEFEVSSAERFVDLVREGFGCVLRGGVVSDTGLIARPVGQMRMVNCASPAYLSACGTPGNPR
jgi:DNA-binding transcriptional LysR family regulator